MSVINNTIEIIHWLDLIFEKDAGTREGILEKFKLMKEESVLLQSELRRLLLLARALGSSLLCQDKFF